MFLCAYKIGDIFYLETFSFQILDAVYRECKKEKLEYKLEALKCMGEVVETFSVDRFEDVYTVMLPVLRKVRHDLILVLLILLNITLMCNSQLSLPSTTPVLPPSPKKHLMKMLL